MQEPLHCLYNLTRTGYNSEQFPHTYLIYFINNNKDTARIQIQILEVC